METFTPHQVIIQVCLLLDPTCRPSVKYSLADNMGRGKNPMVQSQTDAPEEGDL